MKMTLEWRKRCESAESEEELDKILDEWEKSKNKQPEPENKVEEEQTEEKLKTVVYFGIELSATLWKCPPKNRAEAISHKKCELALEKKLKEKEERRKRGEVIDDDDD